MSKEFPKQKRPLYCWQLNEVGSLIRLEPITQYSATQFSRPSKKIRFCFYSNGYNISATTDDHLDKFYNGKIYSFKDDEEMAKQAVIDVIETKLKKAKEEVERYQKILNRLNGNAR